MKALLCVCLIGVLAATALAADVPANILKNPGAEEGQDAPAAWSQGRAVPGVEYLWDRAAGHEGKASLCLNKTAQRYFPIAQWRQEVEREGTLPAIKVSAQVKTENVTKAILDVLFLDQNGQWISHSWVAHIGAAEPGGPTVTHDWREYSGRIEIPANTKSITVGLQIYGPGEIWFDEVQAVYAE
jgi:RNA polymerase sigma-70 factor (ECF subfamily)